MSKKKKRKREETETKFLRPKLLKTLNMNQFYRLKRLIIWKMAGNSSSWTKFDPLITAILWIYNFSSLVIMKVVAFHKF